MKRLVLMISLVSTILFSGCSKPEAKPIIINTPEPQEIIEVIETPESTTPAIDTVEPVIETETPVEVVEPEPEPVEEQPIMPEPSIITDFSDLSNESKSWYYMKNPDHEPPFAQKEIDLSKYNSYFLGDTSRKVIYLTFDEGYENGFTPAILDTLKEKGVHAAFFMTKSFIKSEPELAIRMVEEGHLAVNHSATHPSFPTLSDEEIIKEIEDTANYFKEVTGYDMKKFVRPPQGTYSERSLAVTASLGYKSIFWSFAHKDWEVDNQPGADVTYQSVMKYCHNGEIILLHAVSESNTQALPRILDSLLEEGYTFDSLENLPS